MCIYIAHVDMYTIIQMYIPCQHRVADKVEFEAIRDAVSCLNKHEKNSLFSL